MCFFATSYFSVFSCPLHCYICFTHVSGMRFLATARPGRLEYMSVTKAGLLDPSTIWYAPAIKVDYNVHTMHHLQVIVSKKKYNSKMLRLG